MNNKIDVNEMHRLISERKKASNDVLEEGYETFHKATRVTGKVYEAPVKISELAQVFENRTKLTELDVTIMFIAIGLQIVRQFLQSKFSFPPERLDDKTAAGEHNYSKDARNKGYYNPSLEEIISKPVPFDVIDGADGKFKGSGFLGHRGKTVGHDPLLGLIIGTANIATATVTISNGRFNYQSYHVRTNEMNRDSFAENADTIKVLHHTYDKIANNTGGDGRARVAAAFGQEIIHLKSDVYSKKSLPLPIISSISPELAGELAKYGFDCANALYVGEQLMVVAEQIAYAKMINYFISIFHRLFYDGSTEQELKLYEVRTRKIISYSNMVATAFNLGKCGFDAYNGDYKKAFEEFDLGGLCVTVWTIINNQKFMDKVRHEFVIGEFRKEIDSIVAY